MDRKKEKGENLIVANSLLLRETDAALNRSSGTLLGLIRLRMINPKLEHRFLPVLFSYLLFA
jgi:hypothetical protein